MINYNKIKQEKLSAKYLNIYRSSTIGDTTPILGTIEKDAAGHCGPFQTEAFRGKKIFDILINKKIDTVLDVGAGKLETTEEFIKHGKIVDVCDFQDSWYLSNSNVDKSLMQNIYIGDINNIDIPNTYDAVWAAHILEHQPNPNIFLKKLHSLVKESGYLAIVVPPRKPFIVGGHVNMWNGGLLLYHLILAGFDCSGAQLLQYDYNIGVVVRKKTITPPPKINYDIGDLHILEKYFPLPICEGFNGDIMKINVP